MTAGSPPLLARNLDGRWKKKTKSFFVCFLLLLLLAFSSAVQTGSLSLDHATTSRDSRTALGRFPSSCTRGKGKSRNAPNLFYRLFSLVMFTCFFYIFRLMHFLHRIFIIVTAYGQMKASDICAHHLCECDRQFAECIRNYPCPAKKTTCPSNPLRSLG